jgi:dipeptidase D
VINESERDIEPIGFANTVRGRARGVVALVCAFALLFGVAAFGGGCEKTEAPEKPVEWDVSVPPDEVLGYFERLVEFPRSGPSYPKAIDTYLLDEAKSLGASATKDSPGNVTARLPATEGSEGAQPIALLAYTGADIVSLPSEVFDPYKDGVSLVPQGSRVRAEGTSMGADGALGAATILAVLKDLAEKPHGDIVAVFAAGTGEVSSQSADPVASSGGAVTARKPPFKIPEGALLINIGGVDTGRIVDEAPMAALLSATSTASAVQASAGRAYVIGASGFPSGTAGTKTADGYVSPISVISKILSDARNAGCVYQLCGFSGGDDACSLPESAQATVILGDFEERQFKRVANAVMDEARETLGGEDSGADIAIIETVRPANAISEDSVSKALTYLYGIINLKVAGSGSADAAMSIGKLRLDTSGFECDIAVSGRYSKAETVDKIVTDQVAIEYLSGIPSRRFGYIPGFSNYGAEDVDELSERFSAAYAKALGGKPRSEAAVALSPLGKLAEGRTVKSIGVTVHGSGTPNEYFETADAAVPANAILRYVEGEAGS